MSVINIQSGESVIWHSVLLISELQMFALFIGTYVFISNDIVGELYDKVIHIIQS